MKEIFMRRGTVAFVIEVNKHDIAPQVGYTMSAQLNAPQEGNVIGWAIWTRHGTSNVELNWRRFNCG